MRSADSVCVIGAGRIGLPISVSLAQKGMSVRVLDIDENRCSMINNAESPFFEEGMQKALEIAVKGGFLEANSDPSFISECDVVISAIGTGISEDGEPDVKSVNNLAKMICNHLQSEALFILKTTLPIGSTKKIANVLAERSGLVLEESLFVAFSPERIVEGKAMEELRSLPKIVGGVGSKSTERASEFMSKFGGRVIKVANSETAEMCKLIDNAYRMTRFGFSSDVALVASQHGIDAYEAIRASNLDYKRNDVPLPSVGVSGYCLTKDPHYLEASGGGIWEKRGFGSTWINARKAADYQLDHAIETLEEQLNGLDGKVLVVAGLTYKEDVDDTRQSHGVYLSERLSELGAEVRAWEPNIAKGPIFGLENFHNESCLADSDGVIFTVPHSEFIVWSKEPAGIETMRNSVIFDGWGIFEHEKLPEGTTLMGTGRGFENT